MKMNIKLLISTLLLTFVLFSCDKQGNFGGQQQDPKLSPYGNFVLVFPEQECYSGPVALIAGQNKPIGTVSVIKTDGCLNVTYKIDNPDYQNWALTEVHLAVVKDPKDFPVTSTGNPKIGLFTYNYSFMTNVKEFTVPVCDASFAEGPVYIAAHGVACEVNNPGSSPDLGKFCASLPDMATVTFDDGAQIATISGGTTIDGVYPYPYWCVDLGHDLNRTIPHLVEVLSSICGDNLAGIVDKPENAGLLNYILNQHYLGKEVIIDGVSKGNIIYAEIARAIWTLIDDGPQPTLPDYWVNNDRLNWILADVAANGASFIPKCGDSVALFLVPRNLSGEINGQVIVLPVPINCYSGCETVWAEGAGFPGNSWAMFFKYCF